MKKKNEIRQVRIINSLGKQNVAVENGAIMALALTLTLTNICLDNQLTTVPEMLGVFSSYWVRFLMALVQWCCVLLLTCWSASTS